jgi:hypothetical protein
MYTLPIERCSMVPEYFNSAAAQSRRSCHRWLELQLLAADDWSGPSATDELGETYQGKRSPEGSGR